MKFASLGSGSRGNASLVEAGRTRILLDCGFSVRQIEQRIARLGLRPEELDALLISHEHTDHVRGAAALSRKYRMPVWLTAGSYEACRDRNFHRLHLFHAQDAFDLGSLHVRAFPTPHDAREPCQFVFEFGRWRFGVFTDSGAVTPHSMEMMNDCDALLLECNHDPELLRTGPYSARLKQRIVGGYGHLSNEQACDLVRRLRLPRLQHLVAGHLSETNNRPELAFEALTVALNGERDPVRVASQREGSYWCELC